MIGISLCMIVKNEEDVLGRCLDSVCGLVDEIVIVDTGSNDATVQVARRYTDRIVSFPWQDDFAAARNFSFEQARQEYLLWLDADDVLLDADREAFRALRETLDPSVDVVMMRYNAAFDSSGSPTFSYDRERLLRRDRGFRWEGAVHEAITPAGNVLYSPIAVTHCKTRSGDSDRNLRIYEKQLRSGKTLSPREQFYYARELLYHRQYASAAAQLEAFLDEGRGWLENNVSACLDLAQCRQQLNQPDRAFAALTRSFLYDAPRPEACCALGAYFLERGQYRQAVHWYRQAIAAKPAGAGGFSSPDCKRFIPYMQLCVCYDRLGDRQAALRFHRKAKRLKPGDPAVLYNEAYFESAAPQDLPA